MPVAMGDPTVLARAAAFVGLRAGRRRWGSSRAEHSECSTHRQVAFDRRWRHGGNGAAEREGDEPNIVRVAVHGQKIPVVQSGKCFAAQPLKPENAIAERFLQSDQRDQKEPSGMSMSVPSTRRGPEFHRPQLF